MFIYKYNLTALNVAPMLLYYSQLFYNNNNEFYKLGFAMQTSTMAIYKYIACFCLNSYEILQIRNVTVRGS